MATRYPLSALAFPCVTMLWLSSQMSVSFTTAAGSKHMAILSNVNCTLSSSCMTDRKDTDKFYRLVEIAETIMEVTRPNNSNKLRNMSNNYNNRRDRNVLYPETPGNATNSSIMLFRMDKQDFSGEEVTSAVLKIYIKTKGKRRRRRIILHVSENTADGNLAEFATIKLRVKRKGWQKINLPVYLLTKLQHQPIKLHVGCEKCNKKVRVVLPLKKSKKSQEFRDLGSRKRRSPIIVLNTKPNTAAVASAVATRRLRRPRRDIFRFGSRDTFGASIGKTTAEMSTYATLAKQLHPGPISDAIVDKSPTVIQGNDRGIRDDDEGDRNVLKRNETTHFTSAGSGTTQVSRNREVERKSFSGDNDIYNNDDDDDYHNSSFEYDDSDDDDDDDDEVGLNDDQIADEDEGLNKGCCIKSRFVSFRSIGLNGLVVRPRLGFVSNQCSDRCPTDHLHVTRPPREDVAAAATNNKWNQQASPYRKKWHEIAEFTDQPENWPFPLEKNGGKSLPEIVRNGLDSRFNPEEARVRSSFPFLVHFRYLYRGRNPRLRPDSRPQHRGQSIYDRRWDSEEHNDVDNRNSNSDKNKRKERKEKYSPKKKKKKNLTRRRSCRPVEYKSLNLSFITADLKIEKMTLPDAIVSKCGYV